MSIFQAKGIAIVRKEGSKKSSGKASAKAKHELRQRIGIVSRVNRPAILDFFLGGTSAAERGEFFAKTAYAPSVVKNPVNILLGNVDCFVVPESDLGRKGKATPSQAESIRLWIAKHVVENGLCNADEVAVIFLSEDEDDSEDEA